MVKFAKFVEFYRQTDNQIKFSFNFRIPLNSSKNYQKAKSYFMWSMPKVAKLTQCEKYPYSELFWSVLSRIGTEYGEILCTLYLSVFSPNAGKNGPE